MQTIRYWCLCTAAMLLLAVSPFLRAQDAAHWGIQADGAWTNVPHLIVDKITALPEKPDISGNTFQVGLVRFHANGAPSYALQYSQLAADFSGAQQQGSFRRELAGSGNVRGFMATKYVNVVAKKHVSGGFAFGGGIGKLEASYVRSASFAGIPQSLEANSYNRVVPLFEILARLDVRPVKFLSIGPYYGIRDGMFAAGLTMRLHFTK